LNLAFRLLQKKMDVDFYLCFEEFSAMIKIKSVLYPQSTFSLSQIYLQTLVKIFYVSIFVLMLSHNFKCLNLIGFECLKTKSSSQKRIEFSKPFILKN